MMGDRLDGNPDLYGPLWITTTVVLILFLSSTIQGYLANSNDTPYRYNFDLLSGMCDILPVLFVGLSSNGQLRCCWVDVWIYW